MERYGCRGDVGIDAVPTISVKPRSQPMTPRPHNAARTPIESKIRDLMSRRGIGSYKQLSELAGVDTSTIQRICSGVSKPSLDTAVALAKALGVTVDELL